MTTHQENAPRSLIVAPAWVGDMVMAHTLIRLLAQAGHQIDVAAPGATAPIARRMAEVSQVHVVDFKHGELGLGKRRAVGHGLRAQNYDHAYVLPNSWKSALMPWFANIPQRTGWSGEARFGLLNDRRTLDKERYPLMIDRFMALADPAGQLPEEPPLPKLSPDTERVAALRAEFQLPTTSLVGLCPGAEYGAAKKWPNEHWAGLASALQAQNYQVLLFGSPNDEPEGTAIAAAVPDVINLIGRTRLEDAVDLLSACDRVVCNDSGLMHVACALDVPTVGIFGSTSPQFTPPLGPLAQVAEIQLDCRPCFERVCPLGHLNCLRQLSVDSVLAKISA